MKEAEGEKPPPIKDTICRVIAGRVYSGSDDRSIVRRREMALLQHLSSPFIGSRFRNDLVVLETV